MMANLITGCRFIFSILMLVFPAYSPAFLGCYLAAGFTDMIDGTVARKLGTASDFGAKLDTAADIVFVAAAAYKLLPVLYISKGIWLWICLIALVKIINIISGFVVQKQFVSLHTLANKIAGLMIFVLPLTVSVVDMKYSSVAVCVVASFAAVQEGYFIRIGNNLHRAGKL